MHVYFTTIEEYIHLKTVSIVKAIALKYKKSFEFYGILIVLLTAKHAFNIQNMEGYILLHYKMILIFFQMLLILFNTQGDETYFL